jgi:asparagine synthase (glutamine-hydrolysing)
MESDVPLGALLSGGIDSSLISAAAQKAVGNGIKTFNVRFSDRDYDETWAAVAVARHIGSDHTTLDMDSIRGSWDHVTGLLRHAGQPFADTSLFAAHAVCRLMREHVTVALSGDGGDEGFGGYNVYWQIARIARLQLLPAPMLRAVAALLAPASMMGTVPSRWSQRLREFEGADDISITQNLFSWIREDEHKRLCLDEGKVLPIRRFFEPQLCDIPQRASRLERLSALVTEANIRLVLPNDFLFKVDTASMRESLEVRVPMLDEDLFGFGLSLPHRLKVRGRTCKRVLREIAARHLPTDVARKPKWGFAIPIDTWVDDAFKVRLRSTLLDSGSRLPEFFRFETYRPMVETFCNGGVHPNISRQGLYQRVIMFLALHLALDQASDSVT